MPCIDPSALHCSVYLYATVDDAVAGRRGGGSGFFASVPVEDPALGGRAHIYVVTARHVVDDGARVLRVNTRDGALGTIQTAPQDWEMHTDGDDVAVCSVVADRFQIASISTEMFVTGAKVDELNIGPGDEAFMVGRLIDRDGIQRNNPVVRFGNIAQMPDRQHPVPRPAPYNGMTQESYLIECRSIGGFSGAPVFVMLTRGFDAADLPENLGAELRNLLAEHILPERVYGPWFLGLDWGHPPLWDCVYDSNQQPYTLTDYRVRANSGIAYVAPAWRILDVFQNDRFVDERRRDEQRALDRLRNGQ